MKWFKLHIIFADMFFCQIFFIVFEKITFSLFSLNFFLSYNRNTEKERYATLPVSWTYFLFDVHDAARNHFWLIEESILYLLKTQTMKQTRGCWAALTLAKLNEGLGQPTNISLIEFGCQSIFSIMNWAVYTPRFDLSLA